MNIINKIRKVFTKDNAEEMETVAVSLYEEYGNSVANFVGQTAYIEGGDCELLEIKITEVYVDFTENNQKRVVWMVEGLDWDGKTHKEAYDNVYPSILAYLNKLSIPLPHIDVDSLVRYTGFGIGEWDSNLRTHLLSRFLWTGRQIVYCAVDTITRIGVNKNGAYLDFMDEDDNVKRKYRGDDAERGWCDTYATYGECMDEVSIRIVDVNGKVEIVSLKEIDKHTKQNGEQ